jgi:hypothetical protein
VQWDIKDLYINKLSDVYYCSGSVVGHEQCVDACMWETRNVYVNLMGKVLEAVTFKNVNNKL